MFFEKAIDVNVIIELCLVIIIVIILKELGFHSRRIIALLSRLLEVPNLASLGPLSLWSRFGSPSCFRFFHRRHYACLLPKLRISFRATYALLLHRTPHGPSKGPANVFWVYEAIAVEDLHADLGRCSRLLLCFCLLPTFPLASS